MDWDSKFWKKKYVLSDLRGLQTILCIELINLLKKIKSK